MTVNAPGYPPIVPAEGMSLYIHVPFCQTKCPYCDFNTYQGIEGLMAPYLQAVTTELQLWGEALGHPVVNTVFFGGGTPSYLSDGGVGQILEAARRAFALIGDAEITLEANPGDLTRQSCREFLEAGVNRLSIGVQSLDNKLLDLLGRRHDADGAIKAFVNARVSGFDNINLDLMYGLPHQNMAQWESTLERLASLSPAHISLYALTLEEGTPMHRWVEQGKLPHPDPDLAADMYHHAEETLEAAGYHHYEISNWSRPGLPSRHNMAYWRCLPYLGVGPGAHSCLGHYRFWEVASPRAYIQRVKAWAASNPGPLESLADPPQADFDGLPPVEGHEYISLDTAAAEAMFLGLRLLDGMDLAEASTRLGIDLWARYSGEIKELLELGLLERSDDRLRLTREAYLVANQVFTRFL